MIKKTLLQINQNNYPNLTLSISGSGIKITNNKIVIKDCLFSIDEIAGNELEMTMNLTHLKEMVKFLEYILSLIDEESNTKLYINE